MQATAHNVLMGTIKLIVVKAAVLSAHKVSSLHLHWSLWKKISQCSTQTSSDGINYSTNRLIPRFITMLSYFTWPGSACPTPHDTPTPCAAGSYSNGGATSCTSCPAGQYQVGCPSYRKYHKFLIIPTQVHVFKAKF